MPPEVKSVPLSRSADAFYSLKLTPVNQSSSNAASFQRNASLRKLGSSAALAPAPAKAPPLLATEAIRVSLHIRCETMWGDQVVLVGSSPQLGGWQPERSSILLHTDASAYPVWRATCELELPASGEPLEFKCVVVRGGPAGVKEWEPLPNNRQLLPNQKHISKAAHAGLVWGEPGASLTWRWEW